METLQVALVLVGVVEPRIVAQKPQDQGGAPEGLAAETGLGVGVVV